MEGYEDSSLRLICRMDISMIETANGTFQYFVNDVTRGAYICLFSSIDADFLTERVADELGPHFMEWIQTRAQAIVSQASLSC